MLSDVVMGRSQTRFARGRVSRGLAVAAVALAVFASAASASTVFSKLPAEMLERRYAPAVGVLPTGNVLIA
jgi:hypothetical protein